MADGRVDTVKDSIMINACMQAVTLFEELLFLYTFQDCWSESIFEAKLQG